MKLLTLLVPCYNEENNVVPFYNRCKEVLSDINYEIVYIDDGSTDNTIKILQDLVQKHSNVKVIQLSRNFGKESAIYAGLENANGKFNCIIDADLQQDPEIAKKMLDIICESDDLDIVTAFQEIRNEGFLQASLKKKFYKMINRLSDVNFQQDASDFRLFNNSVKDAILGLPEYFRFSKGIFSWVGFNVEYIPYTANERFSGESKWSLIKLFKYAVEGIVSYSVAPLRTATYVGVFVSIATVIYALVVFVQKIFYQIDIPGYATIVILILFFGGLQLLVLGILGEYLAKTYIQGKQRPIYIAKKIYSNDREEQ